jgi:hypothetical protein
MAAASAWRVYREFKTALGEKKVTLNATDVIKCALFLSTSNCGDVALATAHYATLTNQHGNQSAPGYETGGKTVAATWAESAGTVTFDVADVAWTATGGSIVARFAVLYDDSASDKDLIAYCLLDATPADITCTAGNTWTISMNVAGVFTLAGAEA